MDFDALKEGIPATPAFVLDEDQIDVNLHALEELQRESGCRLLYSMKALPLSCLLEFLYDRLDGISVSSLFEARLAKDVLGERAALHLTTPGLREFEFAELGRLCSHISFNSLPQFHRMHRCGGTYSGGLRINPKLSFADDMRYDPCRPHSKLGVDIRLLDTGLPQGIEGLHFHNVFSCRDVRPLLQTTIVLQPLLRRHSLQWLNMGGGYLYQDLVGRQELADLIKWLRGEFGIEVFVEPGKGVVGNAGFLLTTVLDRFMSDGKTVLVLDTSVNHHPEVFEYQRRPNLLEAEQDDVDGNSAILAGATCMAGDLFGEYRFRCLPKIGDRLLFADLGAYSLIKAHRFNGCNLPDIYRLRNGQWSLCKRYGYEDFLRQWH